MKWLKKGLLFVFGLGIVVAIFGYTSSGSINNELSDEVILLTDTYPTDIIVYGNEIGFDEGIPCRIAEAIDSNIIYDGDNNYFYRVLIINDLEDELLIDESGWIQIDRCIESGCNLYYVGTQYLEFINDRYNCRMGINDTDMFIGVAHEANGTLIGVYGVWDTETYAKTGTRLLPKILLDVVVSEVKDYARQL